LSEDPGLFFRTRAGSSLGGPEPGLDAAYARQLAEATRWPAAAG
jgi:hypothetical protein